MRVFPALTSATVAGLSLSALKREIRLRATLGSSQNENLALLNSELSSRLYSADVPADFAARLEESMAKLAELKKAAGLNSSLGRTRQGVRRDPVAFLRLVTDEPGPNARLNRRMLEESGNGHLTFESIRAEFSNLFEEIE